MALSDDIKAQYARRGPLAIAAYALEAFGLLLVFGFFKILPLDAASYTGGLLGRVLGPRLGAHKLAQKHIKRAMPELSDEAREKILIDMWDNLGRTMAEYPHLDEFKDLKRIELDNMEHVYRVRDDNLPGIFIGGHMGNWEISPIVTWALGVPLAVAYRNPNNPFVGAMLEYARKSVAPFRMPKGAMGGMGLVRHLKKGGHLGMLVDQKLNEGLPLKFFGLPAMTAPAVATWAIRMRIPMLMIRVKRLKGAHFRVGFIPFEGLPEKDDIEEIAKTMQAVNDTIEAFIRETPAQWLWMHRRWKED
jgi:KDO2-lipid IV(A) lauroyltransferase